MCCGYKRKEVYVNLDQLKKELELFIDPTLHKTLKESKGIKSSEVSEDGIVSIEIYLKDCL